MSPSRRPAPSEGYWRCDVMSIDMAAKKCGIDLERDAPKPGQRRVRDWALLIGTARKLEAQEAHEVRESHRKIQDLSTQVVELTLENASLKEEIFRMRLQQRARDIEMSKEDSRYLLTGEKVA